MKNQDHFVTEFSNQFEESYFPADFIAQYELLECLGNSAYGETYLIKDRESGVHYIAKCYPLADGNGQVHEGELLQKLRHEGLPEFIAQYQNEQILCVVRTFQCGLNLKQLVEERLLSYRDIMHIAEQLCDLLAYLHAQSPAIIHRDIKPQNIIVDENLNLSLIDFGISRQYKQGATEDTIHMGTRDFAAPEQFGYCQTDERSDIYSLGVVIHWLLKRTKIDGKRIPKPVALRLRRVISKCTAFDPKDRFQSASAVKNALTGRKPLLFGTIAGILAVAGLLAFFLLAKPLSYFSSGEVHFKEPLIEEAVRLSLGKSDGDPIRAEDLAGITELRIFGDHAAANNDEFQVYANDFANSGGQIKRGAIQSLADLAKMPNLRQVALPYQNISDLKSMPVLIQLEQVDLRHNPITDVSPLAKLPLLENLSLFETLVSDLTPLSACTHLATIDIGKSQVTSMAALDGLNGLRTIVAYHSPVNDLSHIENHTILQNIYLNDTQVSDLTPLLKLPKLKLLALDESMQPFAEVQLKQAQFEIRYIE